MNRQEYHSISINAENQIQSKSKLALKRNAVPKFLNERVTKCPPCKNKKTNKKKNKRLILQSQERRITKKKKKNTKPVIFKTNTVITILYFKVAISLNFDTNLNHSSSCLEFEFFSAGNPQKADGRPRASRSLFTKALKDEMQLPIKRFA